MIKLFLKISIFRMFYYLGWTRFLPFSLIVSVSYKCNSRCKTCFVWQRNAKEFTLEEFDKTFKNLGSSPYWVTISGGEPFLRTDIVEICKSLYSNCRPAVINIPTNGILSDRIPEKVEEILKYCTKSKIVVNVSIDDIGDFHDEIRGVKGNYNKAIETFKRLRNLKYKNFTLGIHSVISKFNVARFREIYSELIKLQPDSYITEIAEQRNELLTKDKDISPDAKDYIEVIDFLTNELKNTHFKGMGKLAKAIRLEYYSVLKKSLLQKREIIPCYAGITTAHISPDGDIWFCCIKAEPVGNLRGTNYDLKNIWNDLKAKSLRKEIKTTRCYCPLANMAYTNMLLNCYRLLKIGARYFKEIITLK